MSSRKNDATSARKRSKPRIDRKQINRERGFNWDDIKMAQKHLNVLIEVEKKKNQANAPNLTRENVQALDRNNPLTAALEIAKAGNHRDTNAMDAAKNEETMIRDIIREKSKVIERVEMFAACGPNVPKSDLMAFRNVMNIVYDGQLDHYTRQSSLPSSSGISSALAHFDKSSMLHRFIEQLPPPRYDRAEMSQLSSPCLSQASHIGGQQQRHNNNDTSPQTSQRILSQMFEGKRDLT